MPAILKGFFDRVFSAGFAFKFQKPNPFGLFIAKIISYIPVIRYYLQPFAAQGPLKDKKVLIIRSYGGPLFAKRLFNNFANNLEISILRFCQITKIQVIEFFNIGRSTGAQEYESFTKNPKPFLDFLKDNQ